MRLIERYGLLIVLLAGWQSSAFGQYPSAGNSNGYQFNGDGKTFRQSDSYELQGQPSNFETRNQAMRPSRVVPAAHGQLAEPAPLNITPVDEQSLPLAPRRSTDSGNEAHSKPQSPARAFTTIISSLAIVLGLFVLVVWVTRRTRPKGSSVLPKEVVDVLGRVPLAAKQQLHLVRLGNKLLLLSVTTNGSTTLSEVSDADEVVRLSGLCEQQQPGSITSTFRQVLSQLGGQSTSRDADGDEPPEESGNERRRRTARRA